MRSVTTLVLLQVLVLTFESVVTIQMKATEQYFPVVLFITLYKVDEILNCSHSNGAY